MAIQAVVYQEHTLGLLWPNGQIEVLRAYVAKGAVFSVHRAPFTAVEGEYRQATKKDFDDYRVSWHPDYLVNEAS